jgi:hypothetical protein
VDHVEKQGAALYSRVCELDLEGIVAKHKDSPYLSENTISTWYKIRNPRYSHRDSLEGMFGVQMVAVHTLAMEMMRRAAFNGQTDLGIDVFVNRSTKLLRIFTELTEP